jgi:hypothetical protein
VTFDEHMRRKGLAYLSELMSRHSGVVATAALEAGRSRTQFYETLKSHGLIVERRRSAHDQSIALVPASQMARFAGARAGH